MNKEIMWAQKVGRALMGKVIEETESFYICIITSFESKKDAKKVGQKVMVSKSIVTLL